MHSAGNSQEPLLGMHALIACTEKTARSLQSGLQRLGAQVLAVSVVQIREISCPGALDAALDNLDSYDWVIFTSSYGVLHFLQRLERRGISPDRMNRASICAVGPSTAAHLANAGLKPALVPDKYVADGIIEALRKWYGEAGALAGRRILLPRAKQARDLLPHILTNAGATVDVAECYENVPAPVDEAVIREVCAHPPDLLVFTSSLTVHNFVSLLGQNEGQRLLSAATVAALGPITAGTVESYGKRVEIIPRENTVAGLLGAIQLHFRNRGSSAEVS